MWVFLESVCVAQSAQTSSASCSSTQRSSFASRSRTAASMSAGNASFERASVDNDTALMMHTAPLRLDKTLLRLLQLLLATTECVAPRRTVARVECRTTEANIALVLLRCSPFGAGRNNPHRNAPPRLRTARAKRTRSQFSTPSAQLCFSRLWRCFAHLLARSPSQSSTSSLK